MSDPHAHSGAIDEAALDRAASSDADFFEQHPHRTHRIRAAIAGELPGLVTPTSGWAMIAVRQIAAGVRARVAFHATSIPPNSEATAAKIFARVFRAGGAGR